MEAVACLESLLAAFGACVFDSVAVEAIDADMADQTIADAAYTNTDASLDDNKDQSQNADAPNHVYSVADTTAHPIVKLPQSAGGTVVEGTIYLEVSEEAVDICIGSNTGHSAEGDAEAGSTEFIAATIDAVDLATTNTARLARRTSRSLRDASAAEDIAMDAYASAVILSDHFGANSPSAADHTRRTNDHINVVRVQAGAIVKTARSARVLDASMAVEISGL